MWRNKTFSIINITGLTLGLAISITIWIWIRFELSYDSFHKQGNNIFLIGQTIQISEGEYKTTRCGSAYAPALESEFPEIRKIVRLGPLLELLLSPENDFDNPAQERKKFIETRVMAVDSTFFEIFTFPWQWVIRKPY